MRTRNSQRQQSSPPVAAFLPTAENPSKRPRMAECGVILSAIQEKSVEKAFVYQTLSSSSMQELRAPMGRTGNVVEMAMDDDAGAAAIEEKSDLDESKPLREQIEALKKEKGVMKKALAENKAPLITPLKKDNDLPLCFSER